MDETRMPNGRHHGALVDGDAVSVPVSTAGPRASSPREPSFFGYFHDYYYPPFVAGGNDATMGGPGRGRSFVVGASYHF